MLSGSCSGVSYPRSKNNFGLSLDSLATPKNILVCLNEWKNDSDFILA